jgi:hypothetical protein
MADPEVATKAPESHVTETEVPAPVPPGDTPAHTACATDRPIRQFAEYNIIGVISWVG